VGLFAAMGFAEPLDQDYFKEQLQKNGDRALNRANWNGSLGSTLGAADQPEFREAWNISDEQYRQIRQIRYSDGGPMKEIIEYHQSPEYLKLLEEERTLAREPRYRNADGKTKADISLGFEEKNFAIIRDIRENALNNLLTAEQKQKIREFELVNMSEWRFISFHSFETFDLTDAQKQELEVLKKEFEPEFERQLEDFVNRQDLDNQMYRMMKAVHEKQGGGLFNVQKQNEIRAKMLVENPEFKRMHEKMVAERELFATQFKKVMFDVLTDEQWDRYVKLLDNPPDYIKAWRKKIEDAKEAAKKESEWQPGPNSWRPGDPIPEQYRQQRNERQGRFPRTESE
jgi:Ni/Co efflux regulator RcnB